MFTLPRRFTYFYFTCLYSNILMLVQMSFCTNLSYSEYRACEMKSNVMHFVTIPVFWSLFFRPGWQNPVLPTKIYHIHRRIEMRELK